jgi:hypothetical protein
MSEYGALTATTSNVKVHLLQLQRKPQAENRQLQLTLISPSPGDP